MPPPLPCTDPGVRRPARPRTIVGASLLVLSMGLCVAVSPAQAKPAVKPAGSTEFYDPFEHLNRRFYASHDRFDRRFVRPVAMAYGKVVPKFLRLGLRNFIRNLHQPVVFANDMLQLRIKTAAQTVGRFALNSTFGIGGTVDVATKSGLPEHDNGFGDTLGHYGVGPGAYLYLPLTGPTDVRDLFAALVDRVAQPINYAKFSGRTAYLVSTGAANLLQTRIDADTDLVKIDEMGTDSYATLRSLYLQNREAEIRGEPEIKIDDLPDFDATPEPAPEPATAPAPDAAGASPPAPTPTPSPTPGA